MNKLNMLQKSLINKKNNEKKLYAESVRGDMLPIYVVLVSGSGYISRGIRAYTNGIYSHAALMLRYYETVSMGVIGKGNGVVIESMLEMIDNGRDGKVKIIRKFVTVEQYRKIIKRVGFYKMNRHKISYSWSKIRNFIPFVPKHNVNKYKDENSFICTEFVSYILHEIEDYAKAIIVDRGRGSKLLVTADEISTGLKEVFEVVYEGSILELPSDLPYDLEKPYDKMKAMIEKDVIKNLTKPKQYNEAVDISSREVETINNKLYNYSDREEILKARERLLISQITHTA